MAVVATRPSDFSSGPQTGSQQSCSAEMEPPSDLPSALAEILKAYSARAGTVHLLDSQGLLHLIASQGIPESLREKLRTRPAWQGIAGMAIERRQVVNSGNLHTDAAGNVHSTATGLRRALAMPIFRGDAVIGALAIETSNDKVFSEVELAALLDAARWIGSRFLGPLRSCWG